ncbi:MAG: electron transfer flavoprotein subunit alpha/FixB family protein [Janthinobacterium lividum]
MKNTTDDHTIRRVDPRRPVSVRENGVIRITVGGDGAGASDVSPAAPLRHVAHGGQPKSQRTVQTAQRAFLVAAHAERGVLDDHARQALAAAALLADAATEVVLLVFGEFHDDAGVLGADKVVVFGDGGWRSFAPDVSLQVLSACVRTFQPVHVFMPDNATGDGDLGRRYAAASRLSVATQVIELDGEHVAVHADTKRRYASRALPAIVLLAHNAVDARLPFVGAGVPVDVALLGLATIAAGTGGGMGTGMAPAAVASSGTNGISAPDAGRYQDLGIESIDTANVALEEADFIVAAGNGVRDVAAFERLAGALGAATGASRVAVDDGRFLRDKQIGATGKTVDASVYIAFGISGAVQHLQGIRNCRHVIAVNTDASAPIAKRANLTIVGDAAAVIAALHDAVRAAKTAQSRSAPPLHAAPSQVELALSPPLPEGVPA